MLGIIQGFMAEVRGRLMYENHYSLKIEKNGTIHWKNDPTVIFLNSSSLHDSNLESKSHGDLQLMCWDTVIPDSQYENVLLSLITMLYILPLAIVFFANGTILVWRRLRPGLLDRISPRPSKINTLLVAVVLTFGLCWGPLHLFTLFNIIFPDEFEDLATHYLKTYCVVYLLCHLIAMTHSIFNPIVYGLFSKDLRVCHSIYLMPSYPWSNSFDNFLICRGALLNLSRGCFHHGANAARANQRDRMSIQS